MTVHVFWKASPVIATPQTAKARAAVAPSFAFRACVRSVLTCLCSVRTCFCSVDTWRESGVAADAGAAPTTRMPAATTAASTRFKRTSSPS
jgi:hypothetical protein